jgi:ABC-type multidrug transport system fused ATPase/permease subunit
MVMPSVQTSTTWPAVALPKPLVGEGARITFDKVAFNYPDGREVFSAFDLDIQAGGVLGDVDEGDREVAGRRQDGDAERADQHDLAGSLASTRPSAPR